MLAMPWTAPRRRYTRALAPSLGSNARFTQLLRDNYTVFGPMGMSGIDIANTRFPVKVARPKAAGDTPDIADVIYGIHRCTHGHGDELPDGFELIPDASGPSRITRMWIEKGKVRLSDRSIFGLLSVAVLSPVNTDQKYHLVIISPSMEIRCCTSMSGGEESQTSSVSLLPSPCPMLS
jgi:hypothetical protein